MGAIRSMTFPSSASWDVMLRDSVTNVSASSPLRPRSSRETSDRRGRVLLDLPRERDPTEADRGGRPHVRRGRHRGDVARHQDECPRRGRPRTSRRDVADHRGRGALDRLDDLPHRGVEASGGVDREQDGLRVLGALDAVAKVVGDERVDHAFEREPDHRGGGRLPSGGGGRGARGEAGKEPGEQPGGEEHAAGQRSGGPRPLDHRRRSCADVVSCDAPAYPARFGRFSWSAGRFPSGRNRGNIGARHRKASVTHGSVYREEPEWTLGTKARSSPGRRSS